MRAAAIRSRTPISMLVAESYLRTDTESVEWARRPGSVAARTSRRWREHGSPVSGMATRKVTVTLEDAQLNAIRKLVDAGSASSVSGFVQHAVSVALDDVAGWGALLAEALRETGGPLTDDERAWADELLGTRRRRRGSAA